MAARVREWVDSEPVATDLLLAGGGVIVDGVRELARVYPYDDIVLHWLCIDLMGATHQLLTLQMPEWKPIQSVADWTALLVTLRAEDGSAQKALVRADAFYNRENEAEQPIRLPRDWSCTSDSLAALMAVHCKADELVLFKSCDCPTPSTMQDWAEQGMVDPFFPQIALNIPKVRWVNLVGLHK